VIPTNVVTAIVKYRLIQNLRSRIVHNTDPSEFAIYSHGANVTPICMVGRGWWGDKGKVWMYYEKWRDGKLVGHDKPAYQHVSSDTPVTCKSCLRRN
jgi:hypothetical protein